jgi:tetratricopeptide (TPR) repeat protein
MKGITRWALPGIIMFLLAPTCGGAGGQTPTRPVGEARTVSDIIFLLGDHKLTEALELSQAMMVHQPKNAEGYYYFCLVLDKLERLSSGERYFLEKLESDPDNPFWMFALACIYQLQTDYPRSLRFLESAIARETHQELFYDEYLYVVDVLGEEARGLAFLEGLVRSDPDNYFLSSSIAELYLYRDDYPNFLHWEAVATRQNPEFVSTVLLNVHRMVLDGRYREAIVRVREWIRRMEEQGRLRDETYFLIQLGNLYILSNDYTEALETINKAFNFTQIIADESLEQNVEELYGTYYSLIGYYGPALEHYRNVLGYAERARHVKMQSEVLLSMGMLYETTGDYQNAFDAYSQALILAVKVQQLYLQTMALKNLADLKLKLNELDESENYYQQALHLALRTNDPFTRCLLYDSLGALEDTKKDYAKAMPNYEQALQLAEALNFNSQKGFILLNIGWNLYNSGKKEQVGAQLDAARNIFLSLRDEGGIGETDYLQGVILYKEGQYREAIPYFEKARTIAVRRGVLPSVIYAMTGIGSCRRKLGELPAAEDCYRKALAMLEEMQNSMQNFQERVRFGEDLFSYYEALISIYYQYYQKGKEPHWLEGMFELTEKAKARNISAAISRSRLIQKLSGISPEVNLQLLLIQKKLELKQREYAERRQGIAPAGGPAEVELKAEIHILEKQRNAFLERIARENPRFSQLLSPGLLRLADLQREIPPETAVVEFFIGEKDAYYWVIRREGVACDKLELKRDRLHQILREVSFNLYSAKKVDFYGDYLKNQRWAGIKTRALLQLYNALIKPLEKHLQGCRRLIVVPDDKLHYLPLEMLVDRIGAEGEVRFLLERYEISYLPYAGMLKSRSVEGTSRAGLQNVLLIILRRGGSRDPFAGAGLPAFCGRRGHRGQLQAICTPLPRAAPFHPQLSGRSSAVLFAVGVCAGSCAQRGRILVRLRNLQHEFEGRSRGPQRL